jgi:hypothetical protein
MAETAYRGKNTKLYRETDAPGVYEEVTAIRELDPPGGERTEIDSTTLSSAATETIPGEPNFETERRLRERLDPRLADRLPRRDLGGLRRLDPAPEGPPGAVQLDPRDGDGHQGDGLHDLELSACRTSPPTTS